MEKANYVAIEKVYLEEEKNGDKTVWVGRLKGKPEKLPKGEYDLSECYAMGILFWVPSKDFADGLNNSRVDNITQKTVDCNGYVRINTKDIRTERFRNITPEFATVTYAEFVAPGETGHTIPERENFIQNMRREILEFGSVKEYDDEKTNPTTS